MAIKNTVDKSGVYTLYGLSTDDKPTGDYPLGSIFYEIDTTKKYVYVPGNTNESLLSDWWELATTTTVLLTGE